MSEEGSSVTVVDDALPWVTIPAAPEGSLAGGHLERVRELSMAQAGRLIVSPDATPEAVEQYRRLAAVMHQAQLNRGIRTVMVASAFAAEGKSLTATNLALTLSESYRRRVLLVDADLRRPTLHETFEIPNLAGVSDWLKSDGAERMPLVEVTPTLTILPGGRPDPDPMSGLTSDRMKDVLHKASERFDWVIVDTPPIAFLPDGHLLSAMVDNVVLVISAGRTPLAAIQRTVKELGPERIIGVVLNRAEAVGSHAYGQAAYYARYSYAPAADGKKARK